MGHALHGLGARCDAARTMGLAAACPVPPNAGALRVVLCNAAFTRIAQVYIGWSGAILLEELAERPYALVGFLAWLILVPLGITSAHSIRRKLGRNWRKLHKLTYAVAILGWLHLLWLSRSDIGEAVVYGTVFVLLFALRIRKRQFFSRAV